jgi:hypothetical protein
MASPYFAHNNSLGKQGEFAAYMVVMELSEVVIMFIQTTNNRESLI